MTTRLCATCRHFDGAPRSIEARLPGLTALSSAYAAVRARDGLCALHDRLVGAAGRCADHSASTSEQR